MDKADEHEGTLAGLITDTREILLRLRLMLRSGPPTDQAVTVAALLHDMRGPLTDAEISAETLAAARRAGRDEGWGHGFAKGYRAGFEAGTRSNAGTERMAVVRQIRAIAG